MIENKSKSQEWELTLAPIVYTFLHT